jgi:hypothetical protein
VRIILDQLRDRVVAALTRIEVGQQQGPKSILYHYLCRPKTAERSILGHAYGVSRKKVEFIRIIRRSVPKEELPV